MTDRKDFGVVNSHGQFVLLTSNCSPTGIRALHRFAKALGINRAGFVRNPEPRYVLPGYAAFRRAQNAGAVRLSKRQAACWLKQLKPAETSRAKVAPSKASDGNGDVPGQLLLEEYP